MLPPPAPPPRVSAWRWAVPCRCTSAGFGGASWISLGKGGVVCRQGLEKNGGVGGAEHC